MTTQDSSTPPTATVETEDRIVIVASSHGESPYRVIEYVETSHDIKQMLTEARASTTYRDAHAAVETTSYRRVPQLEAAAIQQTHRNDRARRR